MTVPFDFEYEVVEGLPVQNQLVLKVLVSRDTSAEEDFACLSAFLTWAQAQARSMPGNYLDNLLDMFETWEDFYGSHKS